MARKHLLKAGDEAQAEATPSRNVLIYIRVSTEKQSQNLLSLNDQENQLVARAKRDGDNIVAIYRDEGETATNMKRAAFEQMIARAGAGDVKQVPLGVVDFFEIRVVRDGFNPFL